MLSFVDGSYKVGTFDEWSAFDTIGITMISFAGLDWLAISRLCFFIFKLMLFLLKTSFSSNGASFSDYFVKFGESSLFSWITFTGEPSETTLSSMLALDYLKVISFDWLLSIAVLIFLWLLSTLSLWFIFSVFNWCLRIWGSWESAPIVNISLLSFYSMSSWVPAPLYWLESIRFSWFCVLRFCLWEQRLV